MRKEDRARLFNEVIQFDAKLLQNGQGSGLGLYLSRKVIDMHGGSIGVDLDWEGVGSKFYIELDVSEVKYSGRGKAALFYAEDGILTLLTHRKHQTIIFQGGGSAAVCGFGGAIETSTTRG
jgi:hypothetical protein